MSALQSRGIRTARALDLAWLRAVHPEGLALFWSRVTPEPNTGCWLWGGGLSDRRYGVVASRPGGKMVRTLAHRIAWVLERGPLPAGADLLHSCDVTWCVNPSHLRVGTQADNNRDAWARGRTRGYVLPGGRRAA